MITIKLENNFVKQAASSLREHLRIPLFANAYMLVANQGATAVLGLLYWTLAARLYPVEEVGENSAIISSIIFLAMLSELSLKSAATRFVPRAGKNTVRLIVTTLGINVGVAIVVSSFLLTLGRRFELTENLLAKMDVSPIWIVLAAVVWTIYYVLDGILTGMRQAKSVLIKNAVQSIAKILLLIVFFRSFADYGLVISWFLPAPVIVLIFGALIFLRFLPRHLKLDLAQTRAITTRELFTSISGDYIGGVLAETSTRLLPLIVLSFLGSKSAAYFNQAWVVATPFYLVATNMSSSFVVESSANMKQISLHSRRILRQMMIFLIPAVAAMWVGAPLLLSVFGKTYAAESFRLLRWLTLATLPFMFNAWFLSYARVLGQAKTIIIVQGAQLVTTLGICYAAISYYGIDSVGMAWLISQSLIFAGALIKSIPVLWPKANQDKTVRSVTRNQLSRRVDWRFLLPKSRAENTICFADGALADSVAAISKQMRDGSSQVRGRCDLAVAVNPDHKVLQKAAEALSPEGCLYAEWSPLRAGGIGSIRRRLKKAGFTWIKWYVPLPNPVQPRFWIPLESAHAGSLHVAQALFPGKHLVHKLMRPFAENALWILIRSGWVPCLSMVAGRGVQTADLFDEIRSRWERMHPAKPAQQLSFLIKTSGVQLFSKIVCLVFSNPDSGIPDWVIKVPRFPEDAASLEHEKIILNELSRMVEQKRSALGIPSMLFNAKLNDMEFYGQTALQGKPLTQGISGRQLHETAHRMTEFQIALAEASVRWADTTTSQEIVDRMLEKLTIFVNSLPGSNHLAQSRRLLQHLPYLPPVFSHNDFTPWNIVQARDRLSVFDWSDAQQKGLPMLDLIYGLSTLAFWLDHANSAESMKLSYQNLVDPQDPKGAVFAECLALYAKRVGIESELVGPLRLLTWMHHSFNELDNYQIEMAGTPRSFTSVCAPLWGVELKLQQSNQIKTSSVGEKIQHG